METNKQDKEMRDSMTSASIEICDMYGYDRDYVECEEITISVPLLNELFFTLNKNALVLYFEIYHKVVEQDFYIINMADKEALHQLLEKGYLKQRKDGKYIFYVSILSLREDSLGECLEVNWNSETSCLINT